MNAAELAIDGLAAQEAESLGACIGRGQTPDTYQDIILKLRGHCEKLPDDRKTYWADQCKALGIELFPPPPPPPIEEPKSRRKAKDE
jgi:hypothetical protein